MPIDQYHESIRVLLKQLSDRRISRREFLRYATLVGLSATTAASMVGVRPASAEKLEMPSGGTLRIAMRVLDVSNPHLYAWIQDSNVGRQVHEYLTRTDQDNVTRPYLAESWEASPDLRTWTFRLRDVKWRDGRSFTADDAAWNLRRVLDPAVGSSGLGLMTSYMMKEENGSAVLWDANAIEVVDDRTLRLNLMAPQVAVPEDLFHFPMAMLDPAENGRFGVGSNGTGPFELVEHELDKRSILKARGEYWGDGPHVDELQFVDYGEDQDAVVDALASGAVDGVYEGQVEHLDSFLAMPNVTIYEAITAQTAVARVQVDREEFSDPRVRKALKLAIDPARCLEVANRNVGAPAEHHHVCPVHPDYFRLGPFKTDTGAARALLAEAGHPDGIDLTISCRSDPPWELRAVEEMVGQWQTAGIRVTIESKTSSEYAQVWRTVPFGFTSWTHRPLGFMALGLAYRTGVPWNESHYSNPRFDELLTQAEGTLDVDVRREILGELEKILQDDGPIVQPFWRAAFVAYNKRVMGVQLHPSQYIFAEQLALDPDSG